MGKSEIKTAAASFRNSLTGKTAVLDTMIGQMAQRGWRTVYFHDGGNGDKTIKDLALEDYAELRSAFLYQPLKFIFISKKAIDKPRHYAHEIAHIVLGHDLDSLAQVQNDDEANAFANHLLKPRFSKNQIIALITTIALGVSLLLHIPGIVHPKVRQATTPAANQAGIIDITGNPSDIVAVTASGDKFHTPDCRYVQNKTNVLEITIEKAIALGKEPCSICRP